MTTPTMEQRIARVFGLQGDKWMRHANAASVWTRFTVLSLLALAIWSRDWIGWYCLIPIALAVLWMMVNPLLFPPPRSTRNWASASVLGERVWSERGTADIPAQFRSPVPNLTNVIGVAGLILLAYGLVRLDVLTTVAGVLIVNVSKLWYLDRMALLFAEVKGRPEYASWDF
ncbi:hypothetical protein KOI35_13925 [Actinoplanes bogorensis]|uniref:Uncharacterized protein n=1 Tax=Paractinoplanes bogorensis TaxID=1610840 RepID=A0ABS5YMC7_9ACTN|nr:DUF6653 family protein [Actinoplanes bogorensis]MBU2664597.1 hypothetical protein [Actinoplanes bogorensis]